MTMTRREQIVRMLEAPAVQNRLISGHYCYLCKKLIKKGRSALKWDYPDKELYAHPKCQIEGRRQSGLTPKYYSLYK